MSIPDDPITSGPYHQRRLRNVLDALQGRGYIDGWEQAATTRLFTITFTSEHRETELSTLDAWDALDEHTEGYSMIAR